jgi:hypothetical protein
MGGGRVQSPEEDAIRAGQGRAGQGRAIMEAREK